jgi:hypothetical protein
MKTVAVDAQTDTGPDSELLEYMAELQANLKEAHVIIERLKAQINNLEEEKLDYRHMWMTECQYSNRLIKEGAEPSICESQVPDWVGSSPYRRHQDSRRCPCPFW